MSAHLLSGYAALLILPFLPLFSLIIKSVSSYLYDAKGLGKYPNQNIFSGITDFAYLYEVRKGLRTIKLHEAHKDKPILRLGPNSLSFSDVNAVRDIYGYNSPCMKGDVYTTVAKGGYHNLIDVVDKADHTRKRRILANAYAPKNIEKWERKLAAETLRLLEQFDKRCTDPLRSSETMQDPEDLHDFKKWVNLLTLDAVASIGLSSSTNLVDKGDDIFVVDLDGIKKPIKVIDSQYGGLRPVALLLFATEWFHTLKKLSPYTSRWYKEAWEHGANWGNFIKQLVRRRIERHQNGEELDDFFECLLEDRHGVDRNLDMGEIEAETSAMMNAGADGTAISLTNTIYLLLKNPGKLAELRKELDATLDDSDLIAPWAKVKQLPYLRACLDESLRIYPPVAAALHRKTPPEGTTITGQFIPGGTIVSMSAYTSHRDPITFPQPDEYRPERWLECDTKAMKSAFIPFSAGARACIGQNFTHMEQNIILATLIRRYDFAFAHKDWEMEFEEAFNLWPRELPLRISRRNPEAVA